MIYTSLSALRVGEIISRNTAVIFINALFQPQPDPFMLPPMGMDGSHMPPMFNNQGDFVPPEFIEAGGEMYLSNSEDPEYYDYLM